MTLHVLLSGQACLCAPFSEELLDGTADILNDLLPALREQGRVAVYVTDDSGIAHIIAAR